MFHALKLYKLSPSVLSKVLHLFDGNIKSLTMLEDEHNYELSLTTGKKTVSDKELIHILSSGTTKGLLLYVTVIASLKYGFDLIIDEIETTSIKRSLKTSSTCTKTNRSTNATRHSISPPITANCLICSTVRTTSGFAVPTRRLLLRICTRTSTFVLNFPRAVSSITTPSRHPSIMTT